jgi:hypothetical protein
LTPPPGIDNSGVKIQESMAGKRPIYKIRRSKQGNKSMSELIVPIDDLVAIIDLTWWHADFFINQ